MPAEVQVPVGEIEEINFDDIPEMNAHLYGGDLETTLCGIPLRNDPHSSYHFSSESWTLWTGQQKCPKCGAPFCSTCLELA